MHEHASALMWADAFAGRTVPESRRSFSHTHTYTHTIPATLFNGGLNSLLMLWRVFKQLPTDSKEPGLAGPTRCSPQSVFSLDHSYFRGFIKLNSQLCALNCFSYSKCDTFPSVSWVMATLALKSHIGTAYLSISSLYWAVGPSTPLYFAF